MLLDLCNILDIKPTNLPKWRTSMFKYKYRMFYLYVMPALKDIANNKGIFQIEEEIYYATSELFKIDYIFSDSDLSDEIAGDSIYGILRILNIAKQYNTDIFELYKPIIRENIQTVIMV